MYYLFLNMVFLILPSVTTKCINARECPAVVKYLEDTRNKVIHNSSIQVLRDAFCGILDSNVMVNCDKIPPCYQPDDPDFCVRAKDCCVAARLAKMSINFSSEIKSLLKKSTCKSDGSEVKVKCGSLLAVEELLLKSGETDACISPNGLKGRCIPLASCYLYNKPVTASYVKHLREAVCSDKDRKVCCAQSENIENVCGSNEDVIYRISGGTVTLRNEFPWAVKLLYSDPRVVCGGTLINSQFVLTAAHCVINQTLVKVRFGGNHSPLDVPVIATIPHENYRQRPINNDIALVRIEKIEYRDNIKWICLPTITGNLPDKFVIVGNGFTEQGLLSQSQLKATLPKANQSTCMEVFKDFIENYNSTICAGGQLGVDACQGDSGGPLMSENKKSTWLLNGIVSGGVTDCTRGSPGFYTRVDRFLNWIKVNMLTMLQ